MTFGEAIAYVMSGMYGEVGFFNGILLILQLSFAGLIVIYLDEVL
jgi:protein transport protein SEC61 subunit alpha